jgi:hypothetical protein
MRRIAKELGDIQNDRSSSIEARAAGSNDDLTHLKATFPGPPDTPYAGGKYVVDIKIPNEYPFRPPVMKFDTRLWHPNVSSQTVCSPLSASLLPCCDSLLTFAGCHLSRHPRLSLVSRPHHQIRPPFPAIPSQHT